jgi:hypothetical protein
MRITPGRDYVFTAWVKIAAENRKPKFAVGFYNGDDAAINPAILGSWDSGRTPDLQQKFRVGKWTYTEFKIPWAQVSKSLDAGHSISEVQWFRIFLGCGPDEQCDFLVDDIRFYPNDGQSATTYYDAKWRKPITTAGVDGKPSQRVSYDDFGRPVQWQKYKADDHDTKYVTKNQEYFLMGALNPSDRILVMSPNDHEFYSSTGTMDIHFYSDVSRDVKISIKRGGIWSEIVSSTGAISGDNTVNIPDISNLNGKDLLIRVEDVTNASIYGVSDFAFTINTQPPRPSVTVELKSGCVVKKCTRIHEISAKSLPDADGDLVKFTVYIELGSEVKTWEGLGEQASPPDGYLHFTFLTAPGLTCTGGGSGSECNYSVWVVTSDGIISSERSSKPDPDFSIPGDCSPCPP